MKRVGRMCAAALLGCVLLAGAPAFGEDAAVAARAAAAARDELSLMNGAAETSPAARARIAAYWASVDRGDGQWRTEDPWSAAFLCYVLKQGGANLAALHCGPGFFTMINPAIAHAAEPAAPLRAHRPTEYAPRVGDILCHPRAPSAVTYDTALATGFYTSHCDIVVRVEDAAVTAIGGNVRNTVAEVAYPRGPDGKLAADPARGVFVILELPR